MTCRAVVFGELVRVWLSITGLLVMFAAPVGAQAEQLELAAAPGSSAPHLALTPAGEVILSFLEPAGDATALKLARLDGERFTDPTTVASGHDWFVNWADFPAVVPLSDEHWVAHWLVRQPGKGFGYVAWLAQSFDAGATFGAPGLIHEDRSIAEHGFVSVYADAGQAGAVWLDGREYAEHGVTQLRSVRIDANRGLQGKQVVDGKVCDCCQTDLAVTSAGPLLAYRDRSDEEIRDIYITRRVADVWESPRRLSMDAWKITGCPVNGPAVAASDERVAVAWFTGVDGGRIRMALSQDAAASFGEIIDLGATDPVGRVDVAWIADDVVVSWLEMGPDRLVTRRVSVGGAMRENEEVLQMSVERNAGFPQMIFDGKRLVFAWTDASNDPSRVRAMALHPESSQW